MATNKNQMSIISEESIKESLEAFKSVYKENKEKYEEENVKVEDVVNLTENFSGKNALLAATVIISVMTAMPLKEFLALMDTAKSITKAKLFEALKGILKEGVEDADNEYGGDSFLINIIEYAETQWYCSRKEGIVEMSFTYVTGTFQDFYTNEEYVILTLAYDKDGGKQIIRTHFIPLE